MEDNIFTISFLIAYLVVVFGTLLIVLIKNKKTGHKFTFIDTWTAIFLAYFLLGFGDIFHLGSRIIIYFFNIDYTSDLARMMLGNGYIITGITMTLFYIFIHRTWEIIYAPTYSNEKTVKILRIILLLAFIARLIFLFMPQNNWFLDPAIPGEVYHPFRLISSIPLYIIGIIPVYLLLVDSLKEKKSSGKIEQKLIKSSYNAAIWFLVSYGCYTITIVFVSIFPIAGMFMIPKTIAYLIALFYYYKNVLTV